jgi:FKBP-type peptidyl-prolyl cis-trans isomerase
MRSLILALIVLILTASCEFSGVRKNDNEADVLDSLDFNQGNSQEAAESKKEADTIIDEVSFDNGIRISWFKRGDGDLIKANDMVRIDFRNKLEDGTVYDGNHLINKTSLPFFLGWNLQTEGWEFALPKLKVGDEVDIFIPAKLARGEKGIDGIVPPNANNILAIRILDVMPPDVEQDGIRIWRVEEAKIDKKQIKHNSKVALHYWVSSKETPRFDNSYKRGRPFELTMGDGNIVPGLYKALLHGKTGDKLMVHIPAVEAYGKQGLPGLVGANQDLFYDLIILDVD